MFRIESFPRINFIKQTPVISIKKGINYNSDVFIKSSKIEQVPLYSEILSDLIYKNKIIAASNIPGLKIESLTSIAGPNELRRIVKANNNNRKFYIPGERPESLKDIPDSYNLENVFNKEFGGSFHIHTKNSDGKLSVQELLDKSVKYADKYAKQNNQPFVIGITDHNSIEGCKEAIRIISQKPNKYKNLRVILGTEISTKERELDNYKLKKPLKFHILAECINPFDKKINQFFYNLNEGRKNPMYPKEITIKEAVEGFKEDRNNLFSLAHPGYPNIKKFIDETESPYEVTKSAIKHFKETAGDKAFYVENYYAGYYGDVALDTQLHKTINNACDDLKLYKAGGIDTHGDSIFYNGVKSIKQEKSNKKVNK